MESSRRPSLKLADCRSQISRKNTFNAIPPLPFQSDELGDLLSFFNGGCRIRVANCFELRNAAYRFIYKIYRRHGFTAKSDLLRRFSVFDALPKTTTLIAENKKGQLCGVLTLVFDSAIGLPADDNYRTQLDSLRSDDGHLCELISFATADETRGSVKIIAALFYCAYLLAWRSMAATHFVINVQETHEKFYCRNLLFTRIGPVERLKRTQGVPVVLLVLPFQLPNMLRKICRIFPLSMLNYTQSQEAQIATHLQSMMTPMSLDEFHAFFIESAEINKISSTKQKQFLEEAYVAAGGELDS